MGGDRLGVSSTAFVTVPFRWHGAKSEDVLLGAAVVGNTTAANINVALAASVARSGFAVLPLASVAHPVAGRLVAFECVTLGAQKRR